MSFIVNMGNTGDLNNEIVFGATEDFKAFNLDLDYATPSQQQICVNFFVLVGGHSTVNILNSDHNFEDCNYVVVSGVETNVVDIDYSVLSITDKNIIDTFAELLQSIPA